MTFYRVISWPSLEGGRREDLLRLIDGTCNFDNNIRTECNFCHRDFGDNVDCNGCYFMRSERLWLKDFIENQYDDLTNCDGVNQIEIPPSNVYMVFVMEPTGRDNQNVKDVWNAFFRVQNALEVWVKLEEYLVEDIKKEVDYQEKCRGNRHE